MKSLVSIILFVFAINFSQAQTTSIDGVKKACMNYIEGFYEGDVSKLEASLQPTLNKFGFWKNKDTGIYEQQKAMSFNAALSYAKNVLEKKRFPDENAPRKVEVLNIGNSIAAAKVTAWWGIDYLLLSKRGDTWMIEQVLWEGPLEN